MELYMESPVGPRTIFNGREVDYFSGCGYLGLQSHPVVVQAAVNALQRYGLSTATSRGSYGEHPEYTAFERQACDYFGAGRVIYFASGYLGMSILTQATGRLYDHIFIDSSAHFSLWDAAQATNRPITPFPHCQVDRLREAMPRELRPGERPLVLSDGVFPISGEIAPLPGYLALVKEYDGLVYFDDAHAVGVLGANGRGVPEYFNIQDESVHTCATLAKALGGYGGIIWGTPEWVEDVDRNSRICAGASPPPLPVTAASAAALEIARTDPGLRQRLWNNVTRARAGLRALGWDLEETPVPVICLRSRSGVNLPVLRDRLFEQGIAVTHVRSYTSTPAGGALRIAIFATHTSEQIEHLVETIARLL